MVDWRLETKKLKKYPHFDSDIAASDAEKFVVNKSNVISHSFYPFLLYVQRWNKWAKKGVSGSVKERPIRYAARRDAYIFSYYRHLLSQPYERVLRERGLEEAVLAYRKIKDKNSGQGKCNIHFARDGFENIIKLENCAVVALDISSYFDSLDHEQIKSKWSYLIGCKNLPEDHFRVFRSITAYSFVDKIKLYERLGFYGEKKDKKTGKWRDGYLIPYKDIPRPQICRPDEFRDKVAGGNGRPSIIQKHTKKFGIPQGSPISDIIANFYLLEFDEKMINYARGLGGFYCRYSDDILIIVPGDDSDGRLVKEFAEQQIGNEGPEIRIKSEKTYIYTFSRDPAGGLKFDRVLGPGNQGVNGLEYLGFRFDGKKVFIRDSTLSNLWRKVTKSAFRHAITAAKRYPDKDVSQLKAVINYEVFIKRFGRVEDFHEKSDDPRKWTFWTYVKRAREVFGDLGAPIGHQMAKHRKIVEEKLDVALVKAVLVRNNS